PTDPELRPRHALLPRAPSRPPRVGRSPGGDDTAHAQRPPHRSGPMETADRTERTHHSAHRIRRRTLNPPTSHELGRVPLQRTNKIDSHKKVDQFSGSCHLRSASEGHGGWLFKHGGWLFKHALWPPGVSSKQPSTVPTNYR